MFQVGRFDPREEDRKKRKAKTKDTSDPKRTKKSKGEKNKPSQKDDDTEKKIDEHQQDEGNPNEITTTTSTLRVIAPETGGPSTSHDKLSTRLTEEAFDDLDLTDDIIPDGGGDEQEDPVQEATDDSGPFDPTDEIQVALHMSTKPIHQAAAAWDLAPFLLKNLERDGYEHFFPIQSLVIPDVIATERHDHIQARDVCVAAPTGSGKTLAFVLPVLNALSNRQIRRLRALVVLPNRDLGTFLLRQTVKALVFKTGHY
jgi:ATP-dependent RNA helicase DDX51/DBP6